MTITHAAAAASATARPRRDAAIDLVRAFCIVGVVVLHAMMVGVAVTGGEPAFVNAADGTTWIVPISWALQVMPLFFVIGGFSGATAFRRSRERGGTAVGFAAGRIHRLLLPAAVAVGTAGALLALLATSGAPADLVALAGFRFGQPLWFLGVFLVCQSLLPALLRLHERAPLATIGALTGAAVCVDVARIATGLNALGFLNLAFVWLTLQQLGFLLADGRIDALSRRTRGLAAAGALAALAGSFVLGIHSPDLVANINPPTTALLLVGIVHTALFSLLRAPLARLADRAIPRALTGFLTPRAMTVYLWHMPVLLALAGVLASAAILTGMPLPPVDGLLWWVTRPLWLVVALGATALVAVVAARVEARAMRSPTHSAWHVGVATATGTAAVAILLVTGTSVVTALIAVGLFLAALRLATTAKGRILGGQRPNISGSLPLG